jgi:citrate lyase subunit beta / citryl-CoA lyase
MSDFLLGPALLFCPADRPDRYDKARERADAVILDLEDAVDPENRPAARKALARHLLPPERTIVRVNPAGSTDRAADLKALAGTGYRFVMASKVARAGDVDDLTEFSVIALCETAAGVAAAGAIAERDNVVALMWGAEDLVASLGGTSSRFADGRYRDVARFARSAVLIAAGAQDKATIDTVHLAIDDSDGLRDEAQDAVASGFAATACIHPGQVEVIRNAYRPADAERARAEAILDAAAQHSGVFRFEGQMVDGPVIRHAHAVLRRAGIGDR